jgi:hypothetical protein
VLVPSRPNGIQTQPGFVDGAYPWFLARWAKRLNRTAVAQSFHTTWTHVYLSVKEPVAWGRTHRDPHRALHDESSGTAALRLICSEMWQTISGSRPREP